ncbi:hypothetical protein OIU79_010861 [Salix purpurea]|uniref:Uncharacterized protein n=1 Tax=Salix purpurea TaxID=77065 RepID=A0A9Q0QH97_SALPP|nr:hypothetical protein OIU79_010861 [Salix purpurea]
MRRTKTEIQEILIRMRLLQTYMTFMLSPSVLNLSCRPKTMVWRLAITVGKPTISDGTETCYQQAMKGELVMLIDEPTTILDGTTVRGVLLGRMLHGLNNNSYTNRRTNSIRWNNSSRNNVPERTRHGLNSYRENDGFSRNENFRGGNGNFWERNQRRRSDS